MSFWKEERIRSGCLLIDTHLRSQRWMTLVKPDVQVSTGDLHTQCLYRFSFKYAYVPTYVNTSHSKSRRNSIKFDESEKMRALQIFEEKNKQTRQFIPRLNFPLEWNCIISIILYAVRISWFGLFHKNQNILYQIDLAVFIWNERWKAKHMCICYTDPNEANSCVFYLRCDV